MIIWYDKVIGNSELGYTLYLDLKEDKEYWFDHKSGYLFPSKEAGDIIYPIPIMVNYKLEVRCHG